ncbi:hypothetical protein (plasmid) [Metabacillus dongyingensis]|nr:hypothetical protein [Metabacillus dongyingensis]
MKYFSKKEDIMLWMDSQNAEDYIHITDSKGLIKSKLSVY